MNADLVHQLEATRDVKSASTTMDRVRPVFQDINLQLKAKNTAKRLPLIPIS